jgi:carboxypeptidase C (cathepsin A)
LQKKNLQAFLKDVETFTQGEYASALSKGDSLPPAERKAVIAKLSNYTGLDAKYLDETNLRWDVSHFTRQLMKNEHETIGRYDGRLMGPSALNTGETSEYDPSSTLITPPFVAIFQHYMRDELNYKTDMYYYTSGGIQPWDYGGGNSFGDTTSLLRNAMVKNPYMKVMVAAGYFDLATPFYAVEYTFDHMGLSPEMHKNITWDFYQAGHMLYIDSDAHAKLKHDIGEFISGAMPKGDTQ